MNTYEMSSIPDHHNDEFISIHFSNFKYHLNMSIISTALIPKSIKVYIYKIIQNQIKRYRFGL